MFRELSCEISDLKVTRPSGLASSLFFHVYSGSNVIGYAQLSTRASNNHRHSPSHRVVSHAEAPSVSYCLKIIEISQFYRNQGVGSALLDELIDFCKLERVASIYGQAKGDSAKLRRWYQERGFEMDSGDNMQLRL